MNSTVLQAAFKTPPASPGGSPDPRVATTCGKNWESFKTEDKTLVVQVSCLTAECQNLASVYENMFDSHYAVIPVHAWCRSCCSYVSMHGTLDLPSLYVSMLSMHLAYADGTQVCRHWAPDSCPQDP